ncbi:MAG TPA: hypothetical protein VFU10_05755, partial [Gaiellaceae bacterium]|nr:hypothetical protein [Gaiellaceae bacterium]
AVVLAGSALAVYRDTIDFFGASPAPERIQLDFQQIHDVSVAESAKVGGAPTITPEGPAREVLRAEIDGEPRSLWVVPTKEGFFCTRLYITGNCVMPWALKSPQGMGAGGLQAHGTSGLDWLHGAVWNDAVQSVELIYQDGDHVKLPFVWVSAPINAGFYAYDVPTDHEQPGHLSAVVVGYDADRKAVTHACLTLPPDEVAASVPTVRAFCER